MPTGHGCNTGWATGFWIRLAHKRAGRGDSGTHPREKRTSGSRLGRNICLSGRDLGLACLDVSRRGQPDYDARMIARQHKADGVKKYSGAQRQPKTTILLQHRPPPDDSAEPFDPGGDSHLLVTIQGILE